MDEPWFRLVLGIFATWRVAHLLAHEDGPWDAVLRLRAAVGDGVWGRMVDCFNCLSLWVAAPVSLLVGRSLGECVLAWLALSGAACLLQRAVREPVVLEPERLEHEGEDDGLLRTTTRSAGDDDDDNPSRDGSAARTAKDSLHVVR